MGTDPGRLAIALVWAIVAGAAAGGLVATLGLEPLPAGLATGLLGGLAGLEDAERIERAITERRESDR